MENMQSLYNISFVVHLMDIHSSQILIFHNFYQYHHLIIVDIMYLNSNVFVFHLIFDIQLNYIYHYKIYQHPLLNLDQTEYQNHYLIS